MESEALNVVDQRTKAKYDLPISKGAVRAMDFLPKRDHIHRWR
jgi:hypothetical protein